MRANKKMVMLIHKSQRDASILPRIENKKKIRILNAGPPHSSLSLSLSLSHTHTGAPSTLTGFARAEEDSEKVRVASC